LGQRLTKDQFVHDVYDDGDYGGTCTTDYGISVITNSAYQITKGG